MPGVSRLSIRSVLSVLAELLLTGAALLFLLAFYLLVWTNVQTDAAQRSLLEDFRAQTFEGGEESPRTPDVGDGLSVLHIPRLGEDWEWVVLEGVDKKTLNDGPGHFPGTALPGEVGNFAVAGHRATHGEPFAQLDKLKEGDKVYVEAVDGWFTYQVTWSRIVPPTAVEVIAPVAGRPGKNPTVQSLTLVTCHPRWASTERLVVGAQLVESRDPAAGPPPALG
ncbi:class E sortase [Nocardioides sp. zg-536]|uniref:Class E sortase n=1 Tax=Nocardioides faecalis TaxID=2803858 RepID=A0A939BXB3_9ACTN|nr:class E sortase [Nocardioides faecalis]MBM9459178.1 class E sortase [Nocardioides faecalis]MBS4751426.1 class E sortase [Nocardioides faecalis]QVI59682.1 class E sortase [Nocardioides faecalis]